MKIQIPSRRNVIAIAAIGIVLACGYIAAVLSGDGFSSKVVIEREAIEVNPSKLDLLRDDRLEDKKQVFDPALVDSRPLEGPGGRWEINASDAVTRLDVDKPRGSEVRLLELYPSYVAAAKQMRDAGYQVLPSINSLDGKAKQFDDGLMAAVMSAVAPSPGRPDDRLPGLLTSLLGRVPAKTDAHAWIFAALAIGGYLKPEQLTQHPKRATEFVSKFNESTDAKPISFYTWTTDLERLWRFVKFLQQPIDEPIANELRSAITNKSLAGDYKRLLGFLASISNPAADWRVS